MSHSSPNDPPKASERSTFIQEMLNYDSAVPFCLLLPTAMASLGTGSYTKAWTAGVLVGFATYFGLAVAYSIAAPVFGWRKFRWTGLVNLVITFFDIISFLVGWL
jgi:hypothetical protein